jgi:cytochrome b
MKTYIWSVPTRIFHWLLAISFATAYLLGGEEQFLNIHASFGTMIGGLIFFRILQGFFGPRYARFSDFPVSPKATIQFISNMRESKALHPGHNPMAALVMLAIMITALFTALSGMMMFVAGESGFFGVKINMAANSEIFEEFHEVSANIFLVLVGIHLTGILVDTIFHREAGTVFSIFTGYKRLEATPVKLSVFQKLFSAIWLIVPLMMFFYVLIYQPLTSGENEETEQVIDNEEDND